jgi:hypothetical protein
VLRRVLEARSRGVLCASALVLIAQTAGAQESAAPAQTGPDRAACVAAHTKAQELKRGGQLLEAQTELQICSSAGCPGALISDCGQWISDLEQMTPSMVFEVRVDGKQVTDFQIQVDGTPVTDPSKALKVNPGRHVVRVEVPHFESKEETVALPEGQRMRLVSFQFDSPKPEAAAEMVESAPPPAPLVMERRTPVIVYPLLGVGVLGLGAFGVLSFLGKSEQSDLESECAPRCSDDDLEPMKSYYLIGDVSAGVGAAALLGAGIVYLARPSAPAVDTAASVRIGPTSAGDFRSFGVSVQRTW